MSVYMEWVDDVERRQQRLARQQFWMRQRREFFRSRLKWKAVFAVLLFIVLATLLGAAMFSDGCGGSGRMRPIQEPDASPAPAVFTTTVRA